MKLYLVPFNAEAKVLTAILPNCRKAPNSIFPNRWEYKGGEVVSWNEMGTKAINEVILKIKDFDKFSSVILFGSAGSLSPDLKLGNVYSCTTIKDTNGKCWQIPELEGLNTNSLLTANELIFDNNKRLECFQKYNCNLVDMEASAFAKLSSENFFKQAKTYIIRFISDNYKTLPPTDDVTKSYKKDFLLLAQKEMLKYRKILI